MFSFSHYILDGHILPDIALKRFGLDNPLVFKYMRMKRIFNYLCSYLDFNIISLGEDCFVRYLTVKWGFMPTAREGYVRLPFDLGITPLNSLVQIIDSPDCFKADHIQHNGDKYVFTSKKLKLLFNHEDPDINYNAADCISKFNIKLQKRLNAFFSICKNKNNIFLWHSFFDYGDPQYLSNLRELIQEKFNAPLLILTNYQTNNTYNTYSLHYPPIPKRIYLV